MRKTRRTKRHIKYSAYLMAVIIGFLRPCTAMAVEQTEGDAIIKHITAFEALPEEDTYFPCMYKPDLEELLSVFPETLFVQIEEEESVSELEVTWECDEDFDNTELELYVFYPKWDETSYEIAESAAESIEIPSITIEVPLSSGAISDLQEAKSSLQDISAEKSILALIYLCDEYDVKMSPSYDSENVVTVVCGQSVQITDAEMDEDGFVWYKVILYQNEKEYTGYVEKGYLATADENFAEWEETYVSLPEAGLMTLSAGYPDVDQFPASYQNALYTLKEKHPNWIFVRMDTGIDWNKAIASELGDKSLVHSSSSGSWQNGTYGQGWSYASEGILKYYMDPRNFLTDPAIFQFEQLTYNSSYHTTNAVQEILKNSFMSSGTLENGQSYAQSFASIGQSLGISPFHLASRVLQEQGANGTSPIISGTYSGYEGYYNFFNVGAAGKTNEAVIVSGLKKAVQYGWNTRYKSLYGGASIVGSSYILRGQDTLYLEKFNVSNGNYPNFTHQYMQNIQAPSSEASGIRKAYNSAGALENSFVFKIPVYNNMPASACSKPETTDAITLNKTTINNLEVNKTATLIPYVNGSQVDYVNNMSFTSDNTSVATVDSQGKITAVSPGTAVISCTRSGANTAKCTVTVIKANPSVSTPALSPVTYQEGLKLSDIALPEGWAWAQNDTAIKVGTASYPAVYTPSDTTKYNTVTKDLSFTVTKAIPNCRVPENLKAKAGDVLGSISLPSGFVWESNAEIELKQAGEYTFYVSYNPDENNYYTVDHIPVIVQVAGDTTEPSDDDQTGTGSGNNTGDNSGNTGNTSGDNNGNSGTSGNNTGDGTTGDGSPGGNTNTSSSSTSTSTDSTGTSTGSTNTSSGSTSTSTGSTGTSSDSTNTSTGSSNTSSGSTNTSMGSTGTSDGSTNTSSGSTNTSTGSTGTSSSSTNISSGSTSTSTGSTGTSSGSTNTSSGSTNTSTGSTNTSTSSTSTSSGSTGTSTGSTNTSTGSTNTSTGSTNTASGGTGNTTGNTNTPAGSTNTSSGDTSASNGNTNNSLSNTDNSTGGGGAAENSNVSTGSAGNAAGNTNTPTGNTDASAERGNTETGTGNANAGNTNAGSANASTDNAKAQTDSTGSLEENTDTAAEEETFFRPSVTIQMEDTTILTAEMLQAAKEQNFNIILDVGDYAAWDIDIDLVDLETLVAIDMGVTIGTNNIPQELITAILGANKYIEITLSHDGAFGFDPILRIALNPEESGRYANLFYYDEEEETLAFICASIIGADGVASFNMDHASSYVIIISDQPMSGILVSANAADSDDFEDSKEQNASWIIWCISILFVLAAIGGGIFFYLKKRSEAEEEDDEDEEDDEEQGDTDDEGYLDEEYEQDEIEVEELEENEAKEPEKPTKPMKKSAKAEAEISESEREELEEDYGSEEDDESDEEELDENESDEEDDWIDDDDWQEPETADKKPGDEFSDDNAEDDWIGDDEWDIGNDWMDDDEWEKKNGNKQNPDNMRVKEK